MANKFLHYRTSVAGREPTNAQIEPGQIAINYRDEYLFIRNVDDQIVIIGSSDAVARATTSVQSVNTVLPDVAGALTLAPANIGANGVPYLDANGKILTSFLPDSVVGGLQYKGEWNASTDTPPLPDPTTAANWYYIVSVSGTYNSVQYTIGDWVISNGTEWQKIDAQNDVTSVAGKTGAVVLVAADISSGVFAAARLGASPGNNMVLTTDGTGAPTWVSRTSISGVTSVGVSGDSVLTVTNSPITSSGTIGISMTNAAANLVLSGPVSGAAAHPEFRSLVANDIPSLDAAKISSGTFAAGRLGASAGNDQVLTTTAAGVPTWAAKTSLPQGTVTSVGVSVPNALLGVSGSPVTSSGTIALSLPVRPANQVFAGPTTGANAAPAFRSLVADDVPVLDEGEF